jgi:DNA-binding MarR family transcriptional regulator
VKAATSVPRRLFNAPIGFYLRRTEHALSEIEFLLLCSLAIRNKSTGAELSEAFGIPRTSLSRCYFPLAKRGLVQTERTNENRRFVILSLTREGAALVSAIIKPEAKAAT